jgi:hypothetical protein
VAAVMAQAQWKEVAATALVGDSSSDSSGCKMNLYDNRCSANMAKLPGCKCTTYHLPSACGRVLPSKCRG